MGLFIRTAVLALLLSAIAFAQQKNNKGTGIGKTDFDPSQTRQKNANEHGDKESNVEDNNPPRLAPPDFGNQQNNRAVPGDTVNGQSNPFGVPTHEEPVQPFPNANPSPSETNGENASPINRGEPVPPQSNRGEVVPNKGDVAAPQPSSTHHSELIPSQGQNPTSFQGPANVPNQPTIIKNAPRTNDKHPVNSHQPTEGPLLEPNEIPPEHGQQPFPIRGPITNPNFPKIADLDTPNTPSPTGIKHEEDLDSEHQENIPPSGGELSGPIVGQTSGPIIDRKGHAKGTAPFAPAKNTNKESSKSNLDEDYFSSAVNAKYSEIIKNLSQANVLTSDDITNESVLKNIKDSFTGIIEKSLRERPNQAQPTPTELEIILQQGADKVIQNFKANRKTSGASGSAKGNQQTFNVGTSQPNFGTQSNVQQQSNVNVNQKSNGKKNGLIISGQPTGQNSEITTTVHSPFIIASENTGDSSHGQFGGAVIARNPLPTSKTDTSEEVDASTNGEPKKGDNAGGTFSPFIPGQLENGTHPTSLPSHFSNNNPSVSREPLSSNNRETFTKNDKTETVHFPTQNPIIVNSNQEPVTVLFGNIPVSNVNRSNVVIPGFSGSPGDHEHGGVVIPSENTQTESSSETDASNSPDVSHIHNVNSGTIAPFNKQPPSVEESHNSKEVPPFVIEQENSHIPTVPSVVPVNTGTLPPFVISSFNQPQHTKPPIFPGESRNGKHGSTSSETNIDETVRISHPPVVIAGGNNNNTFYNISSSFGKTEKGEEAEKHGIGNTQEPESNEENEETSKVHTVAQFPFSEISSTTLRPDVIFPTGSKQTIPPQGPPFDHQHQSASAPGFAPTLNVSQEQGGKPPSHIPNEGENEESSEEPGNPFLHTSFVTRRPLLPIAPLQPNISSAFVSAKNNSNFPSFGFGSSTPFPQPPDWSSPDDTVDSGQHPINIFGQSNSNVSFITGPPVHEFSQRTNQPEIFPPSANPADHFTKEESDERETTKAFSENTLVNNSSLNASTESPLIIVHPGHIVPNIGDSSTQPEHELKNVSNTWANATSIPIHNPFEAVTSSEKGEIESEEITVEVHAHNMSTTEHPLFPVIFGNEVHTTKESSAGNFTGAIPLFNNTANETSRGLEFTTSANSVEIFNTSNFFYSLAGSLELSTQSHHMSTVSSSAENVSSEFHMSMEPGFTTERPLTNFSLKPSENSSAEPVLVSEWTKSLSSEPVSEVTKNESLETGGKSEPEGTKVTEIMAGNETSVTLNPVEETPKTKAKGATATWSLKLLDIEWDSSLNDKASWQYKDLYGSIYPELKQIFQELLKERFVEVSIKHFSQGSVIVNGQTDITERIDNTQLNKEFETALEKRDYKLGGHTVDKSTINVDHPGGSAPQTGARPVGANGVPGYVIGIIVAAIILALVVLAVALLVRRYRTRRLREDHYMVDEETMNGGAVKNWQQHQRPANGNGRDNYAAVNMYEMKDNPNGGSAANPANAHTNYGYQAERANGHSAPSRHNTNMAEIQLHGDEPVDEASTRH